MMLPSSLGKGGISPEAWGGAPGKSLDAITASYTASQLLSALPGVEDRPAGNVIMLSPHSQCTPCTREAELS